MIEFPDALKSALEGPITTLAECWRLTRMDGIVLGFTDHDEDLDFAGTVFEARTGLAASEAETELGLASEARTVSGALSSAHIEEADIAAGLYDGATVETFLVDWTNPTEAHARTDVQTIGEITRGDLAFSVELRSRMAELDRIRGRLYRRHCDAALGDSRCKVDLGSQGLLRTGTIVSAKERAVEVGVSGAAEPSSYRYGKFVIRSGNANGVAREIAHAERQDDDGLRLTLTAPLPVLPEPGDSADVIEGCDKRFSTCRTRFSNSVNFRGFPHIPGSDAAIAVAKSDLVHDGRPLVA